MKAHITSLMKVFYISLVMQVITTALLVFFRITSHLLKNSFLGDERQDPLSGTRAQPFPGARDPYIFPSGDISPGLFDQAILGSFLVVEFSVHLCSKS